MRLLMRSIVTFFDTNVLVYSLVAQDAVKQDIFDRLIEVSEILFQSPQEATSFTQSFFMSQIFTWFLQSLSLLIPYRCIGEVSITKNNIFAFFSIIFTFLLAAFEFPIAAAAADPI